MAPLARDLRGRVGLGQGGTGVGRRLSQARCQDQLQIQVLQRFRGPLPRDGRLLLVMLEEKPHVNSELLTIQSEPSYGVEERKELEMNENRDGRREDMMGWGHGNQFCFNDWRELDSRALSSVCVSGGALAHVLACE